MNGEQRNQYLNRCDEIASTFSFDSYEISRRELFAHLREPSMTIRSDSISFNAACIKEIPDAVYIQVLVSRSQKRVAIRKCEPDDKDAIRWCIPKEDKRKSRKITSRGFSERVYQLMGWDKGSRYKLIGHKIFYQGEIVFVFLLEEFERVKQVKRKTREEVLAQAEHEGLTEEQIAARVAEERKNIRTAFYPDNWEDSFGVPLSEHSNVTLPSTEGYGTMSEILSERKE